MKTTKCALATFLAALMAFVLLAIPAGAATVTTAVYGEFKLSSPDVDVTDVMYYNGDTGVIGYLAGNAAVPDSVMLRAPGTYTVELRPGVEVAQRTILYVAADADVTLRNVRAQNGVTNPLGNQMLTICDSARVTLRLEGENSFVTSDYFNSMSYSVISLYGEAVLTIEGPGSLDIDASAGGLLPGIGHTYSSAPGVSHLIVNSGTIVARGGTFSAGIGGGMNVTINGGTVSAYGGRRSSGLGNGGAYRDTPTITINGGTVTAVGGLGSLEGAYETPGIEGLVRITGGVVYATCREDGFDIIGEPGSAIAGNAVVFADRLRGVTLTQGAVFSNNAGTLYGDQVTVTESVTFPAGSSLTVPEGKTLAVQAGKTVMNNGAITSSGTVLANIAGYGNLIPALPCVHSYTPAVTPPTCIAQGFTTYTCACGDRYIANTVAAIGHDYRSAVTQPTKSAGGSTTHTCRSCGHQYTDSYTAKLARSFWDWIMYIFLFGWIWMK